MSELPDGPVRPNLCHLVKLGGSLLDLPDLPARLRELFRQLPGTVAVLAGGGRAADSVREWSRTFQFDDSTAHGLALESLRLTAALVCSLLNDCRQPANEGQPRAGLAGNAGEVSRLLDAEAIPVLDAGSLFPVANRQPELLLPETWDTTSDSVAAAIACFWAVPSLVLLKSVDRPAHGLFSAVPEGAGQGRARDDIPVDRTFARLSDRIPQIRWCNLRRRPLNCGIWHPVRLPAADAVQTRSRVSSSGLDSN